MTGKQRPKKNAHFASDSNKNERKREAGLHGNQISLSGHKDLLNALL